jgi:hypothetical protein
MCLYAAQKSLEDYVYSYQNLRIGEKQMQNMRFVIGNLHYRVGDFNLAREYFFMIKTDKAASPLLVRRAEDRIEEAKELLKTQAQSQ